MTGAEISTIGKAVIWWVIPLAFAVWQLVSVRREIRRDRQRSDVSRTLDDSEDVR